MLKRTFICLLTFIFIMSSIATASAKNKDDKKKVKKIKNIILFIGDGMHLEHEIAASRYLYNKDFRLVWHKWDEKMKGYEAPVSTWDVSTYNKYALANGAAPYDPDSFDPLIGYNPVLGGSLPFPLDPTGLDEYFLKQITATDSASAGTALATGYKTDDGNIAWLPGDPADGALTTIAERMRDQKGASIGVVSTVPYTHATPATFVSHNVSRSNYSAIGDEIIRDVQPDVVIGGGYPYGGKFTYLSQSLYNDVKNGVVGDYVFIERTSGVDGGVAIIDGAFEAIENNKKLFGLFGGSGGNFESPVPSDTPGAPSISRATIENPLLGHATIAALEVLSRDPDGFFVMIEQGDIDWANHANNYSQMIGCTWDLNEAVKDAIRFVNRENDGINWNNTMLLVTSDHSNSYMRLARDDEGNTVLGRGDLPRQVPNTTSTGTYTPGFVYPDGEVTYASGAHTNELVMLYALSKQTQYLEDYEGAWYPGTLIIDNTQIFKAMEEAAGLE